MSRVNAMSYPANIQQARYDADNIIKKKPLLKDGINDAFELMMAEIESGESEDNEIDLFYNYMVEETS
jgi:hypothetical protein